MVMMIHFVYMGRKSPFILEYTYSVQVDNIAAVYHYCE